MSEILVTAVDGKEGLYGLICWNIPFYDQNNQNESRNWYGKLLSQRVGIHGCRLFLRVCLVELIRRDRRLA